jgi:uncharacterized protein YndB with AHSA1/START domain
MELEIETRLQVLKSASEVYETIVDPEKMSGYFIAWGSSRLEEGQTVKWKFPEFDQEFPIRVGRVVPGQLISWYWDMNGREHLVEIKLEEAGAASTVVTVTEKKHPNNEAGIKWLKGNTEGWANFLACLKAYLEYGINLRKGAFDFLKK